MAHQPIVAGSLMWSQPHFFFRFFPSRQKLASLH